MEPRPPTKIVIKPKGEGWWMIFLYRHVMGSSSGGKYWKLVDELVRCPKKQTLQEAFQAARKECIKYGIITEPEVRP